MAIRNSFYLGSPGSGKTEKFLSLASEIIRQSQSGGNIIIITPSRALMKQTRDRLIEHLKERGIPEEVANNLVLITNMDIPLRSAYLDRGVRVLILSPWKLLHILASRHEPAVRNWLRNVVLVFADEIHSYAEGGIVQVLPILLRGFWSRVIGADVQPPAVHMASATIAEELLKALVDVVGDAEIVRLDAGGGSRETILACYEFVKGGFQSRTTRIVEFSDPEFVNFSGHKPIRLSHGTWGVIDDGQIYITIPYIRLSRNYHILDRHFNTLVLYFARAVRMAVNAPVRIIIHVPFRDMANRLADLLANPEGMDNPEAILGGSFRVMVHHGEVEASKRKEIEDALRQMPTHEYEFIYTCYTLHQGMNIPNAHGIVIHPMSLSTPKEPSYGAEWAYQDTVIRTYTPLDAVLQAIGRVGRPNLSSPGYALVLLPEDQMLAQTWANALRVGNVMRASLSTWSAYHLRVIVNTIMSATGELSEEDAAEIANRMIAYRLSDEVNRGKISAAIMEAIVSEREGYRAAGLLDKQGRLTAMGKILAMASMPVEEALIPIRLRLDRTQPGVDALRDILRAINQVEVHYGTIPEASEDDIETIAQAGIQAVSSKLSNHVETFRRVLEFLSTAYERLSSFAQNHPELVPPQFVREGIDFQLISKNLRELLDMFLSTPNPVLRLVRESLGHDRAAFLKFTRSGGYYMGAYLENLFPEAEIQILENVARRMDAYAELLRAITSGRVVVEDYYLSRTVAGHFPGRAKLLGIANNMSGIYPLLPLCRVIIVSDRELSRSIIRLFYERYGSDLHLHSLAADEMPIGGGEISIPLWGGEVRLPYVFDFLSYDGVGFHSARRTARDLHIPPHLVLQESHTRTKFLPLDVLYILSLRVEEVVNWKRGAAGKKGEKQRVVVKRSYDPVAAIVAYHKPVHDYVAESDLYAFITAAYDKIAILKELFESSARLANASPGSTQNQDQGGGE